MPIDPSLSSPAPEILDYLARHPNAQDTIDGILHWWVLESSIREWSPKIIEAVTQLVDGGFLEQIPSADGRLFYRAAPAYLRTIERTPFKNKNY